jgi:hypothetical protein
LLTVDREGFFTKHRLSARDAVEHVRGVQVMGRRDIDGIDAVAARQLRVAAERLGDSVLRCKIDGFRPLSRGNSDEFVALFAQPGKLARERRGHASRTENSPAKTIDQVATSPVSLVIAMSSLEQEASRQAAPPHEMFSLQKLARAPSRPSISYDHECN